MTGNPPAAAQFWDGMASSVQAILALAFVYRTEWHSKSNTKGRIMRGRLLMALVMLFGILGGCASPEMRSYDSSTAGTGGMAGMGMYDTTSSAAPYGPSALPGVGGHLPGP
jgi:hypothetical protein